MAKWLSKGSAPLGPESLLALWKKFSSLPRGSLIFSKVLGSMVPYSNTIGAEVIHLAPGSCQVKMKDRRKVRNHLKSIHAVALTNLGELATGLATLTGTPPKHRGIVKRLETEFLKKARGTLVAKAEIPPIPPLEKNTPFQVVASLMDENNTEVARVTATWMIGPVDQAK